jgi:hypothetical protein
VDEEESIGKRNWEILATAAWKDREDLDLERVVEHV